MNINYQQLKIMQLFYYTLLNYLKIVFTIFKARSLFNYQISMTIHLSKNIQMLSKAQ